MNAGIHQAKPISAALGETKNGKEHVAIQFDVNGERVTYYGFFGTDKQTEFTVKALRTCGWTGDDLTAIQLSTAPVELVVEEQEYNGQPQVRVKYVNPIGGKARQAMDAAKARAFAERMKAKVAATNAQQATDSQASEDQLPF